ncbi:efflux RND transporter permease subunit, partial [bacterium]|nr:efflux RND transporter permease subunit [bacterium]
KLLANISRDVGPNTIERENVQRKMVVSCNVADRDLGSLIGDIRKTIDSKIKLPDGYYVVYGGQFESEQEATRTIAMLSILSIFGVFILLFAAFGGFRLALLTMINLPLSLIGGIIAVFLTGGVLSVAGLVGFVTLFGIATRNGIMMILHYQNLLAEGKPMQKAIVQGSMERLSPILMTALTAGLALIPLIINRDAPGNELQAPMAIVILGGLLSSTLLTLFVLPPLFSLFGRAQTASIAFDENQMREGEGSLPLT